MMSERLRRFLDSYEDFELAYVCTYKLGGYMPETQTSIREYAVERGLSEERINQIIQENATKMTEDDFYGCPRCKSKKLTTESVEITSGKVAGYDGLIGRANYENQTVCSICGYRAVFNTSQEDTRHGFLLLQLGGILLSLLRSLLRFFK